MLEVNCSKCQIRACYTGEANLDSLPDFCPMRIMPHVIEKALEQYSRENFKRFYVSSAWTEKQAYEWVRGQLVPVWPRIREVIEFCKRLGIIRIGVAFCVGLSDEARRVVETLEKHGLKVYSVICQCGGVDKTDLGVRAKYKLSKDKSQHETACNPISQAYVLNEAETELNLIVGLCLGHDILFNLNSKAPVTTLIVKDRVSGHNPTVSLYCRYMHGRIEP